MPRSVLFALPPPPPPLMENHWRKSLSRRYCVVLRLEYVSDRRPNIIGYTTTGYVPVFVQLALVVVNIYLSARGGGGRGTHVLYATREWGENTVLYTVYIFTSRPKLLQPTGAFENLDSSRRGRGGGHRRRGACTRNEGKAFVAYTPRQLLSNHQTAVSRVTSKLVHGLQELMIVVFLPQTPPATFVCMPPYHIHSAG